MPSTPSGSTTRTLGASTAGRATRSSTCRVNEESEVWGRLVGLRRDGTCWWISSGIAVHGTMEGATTQGETSDLACRANRRS